MIKFYKSNGFVFGALGIILLVALYLSIAVGATKYDAAQLISYVQFAFNDKSQFLGSALEHNIFIYLRLPRALLCGLTGAVLALSGTLMQGLFRNPIVEPGLIGTSSGAALGAAIIFVFGKNSVFAFTESLGAFALPFAAFTGALLATFAVYSMATSFGKINIFVLLLSGIAVNALCQAGTGFMSYLARDPQARSITFWNLGTFTSADWNGVMLVLVFFIFGFFVALYFAKSLNALMLGEDEAQYLGVNIKKMTRQLLFITTLMVAVATSMVGVIAFIGLIVPHILRLLRSSNYFFLIPASALLGAIVMEFVDIIARIMIPPAELPIGIITAVIGAPIFLLLLLRQKASGF